MYACTNEDRGTFDIILVPHRGKGNNANGKNFRRHTHNYEVERKQLNDDDK